MKAKLPCGTLERLWQDRGNWRGGMIYVCKDDPRFIVPKKPKWTGWTLNFAHGSAWAALVVCALVAAVPATFIVKAGLVGTGIWWVFLAAFVIFVCGASCLLASPRWYESKE